MSGFFKNHNIDGWPICYGYGDKDGEFYVMNKDETTEVLNLFVNPLYESVVNQFLKVDLPKKVAAEKAEMERRYKNIDLKTHKWTGINCPVCGFPLKKVLSNNHVFCSNHESICDYEQDEKEGGK